MIYCGCSVSSVTQSGPKNQNLDRVKLKKIHTYFSSAFKSANYDMWLCGLKFVKNTKGSMCTQRVKIKIKA